MAQHTGKSVSYPLLVAIANRPPGLRWSSPWGRSDVDVPRIRTVELNVTRDLTDLEGDDVKIATHTFAKGRVDRGGQLRCARNPRGR